VKLNGVRRDVAIPRQVRKQTTIKHLYIISKAGPSNINPNQILPIMTIAKQNDNILHYNVSYKYIEFMN